MAPAIQQQSQQQLSQQHMVRPVILCQRLFSTTVQQHQQQQQPEHISQSSLQEQQQQQQQQQAQFSKSDAVAAEQDNIDEDIEEWLTAIKELRTEFSNPNSPYNPEISLAAPGENRVDIATMPYREFKPTEEQLSELSELANKQIPLPKDEVLEHCTNLIMKHGKKARAEKLLARALYVVKLQLRKDPVVVLKDILEQMAPLMVVKTFKNRTAKSTMIPVPLGRRQRLRTAFSWILDGASKRQASSFSVRLGEELIAAYNGNSNGFAKRAQMHKDAMSYRAYIKL